MQAIQIIQLVISVFLLLFGSILHTNNFISTIFFKVFPLVSAFVLGLIAFKVIV